VIAQTNPQCMGVRLGTETMLAVAEKVGGVQPDDTVSSAFQVMVKPVGAACNLHCEYCFYLSKLALYPHGSFRMSDRLLEEFTSQYIAAAPAPELTFAWQGGEPLLMGLSFFQRALELQEEYSRQGLKIVNTVQTNGTMLDDDWCCFLRDHGFLVGLSLDGPRQLHDVYRVDERGNPTCDRVLAGALLLKEHGVEFNVLCCVHAANAHHPLEVYRFLRDEVGAQFIQFIPIVERGNAMAPQESARVNARSVTGPQYGEFLITIFDEWVQRDVGRVFVQIFDVALAAWLGQPPGLCIFEETCGTALALEHNGDLYACDHFVDPRHRLGNIQERPLTAMVASRQQQRFGWAKRETLCRACRDCEVGFVCNGGCPKDRVLQIAHGEPALNYLCEGYKAFFTHIDRPMRIMSTELRARRPAANVMPVLAKEELELERRLANASRNEPCPCGSGRKVKHCCGRARPSRA